MTTFEIKYNMGDIVYSPSTNYAKTKIECPDCLGKKVWTVRFATGEEVNCDCQTCNEGYTSTGFVSLQEYSPKVETLTIGQVGFEDGKGRYMCNETGI